MITTIIFFILLFAFFALYYIRFIVKYAINKKPNPLLQEITIVESRVYPITERIDFCVWDGAIKEHGIKFVRNHAAQLVCGRFFKLIEQDVGNQVFKLIHHKNRFKGDVYNNHEYFTIAYTITPEYETRVHYDSKLI